MIGVSPAFIVSLYGPAFSIGDICDALPRIKRLGFSAYQPEIFVKAALPEWMRDAQRVHRTASDLGLVPTQFVAHFLLEQFASAEQLDPYHGLDELKQVIEIVRGFSPCDVLTIPAAQFTVDWSAPWATSAHGWQGVRQRLVEKIGRYVELVSGAGLKLAFEILPFSAIGGLKRFMTLCDEIGSPALGLNLDTGHAWACRELAPALPFELRGRIFGLHLGDNLSTENVKRPPGKGSIPWKPLVHNLLSAGYQGSFDIDIGCPADEVEEQYRVASEYLESLGILPKGERA